MREQGRSRTGTASLPHVNLAPMSVPGPIGERQEHLDAIVSLVGAGQRRRLFRGLDILTITWATGDLSEECRFLLNMQKMFLKKEKDPTSKQFDDDEWIRSLTEAQEITVIYDQQEVDTPKVRPIQMGEFLRKYVSRQRCGSSELGPKVALRPVAIFHHLFHDEWAAGSLNALLARIKVDEQCFGMNEWRAVREAASRFLPCCCSPGVRQPSVDRC